ITYYLRDLRNPAAVADILFKHKIARIVNLTGYSYPGIAAKHSAYSVETEIGDWYMRLLSWARREGVVVVNAGTSLVYGTSDVAQDETAALFANLNPYIELKLLKEFFSRYLQAPVVTLRLANVYGPDMQKDRMIAVLAARIARQEEIELTDGARDYIHVEDVVRAVELALLRRASGLFNVGSGRSVTSSDLAGSIAKIVGSETRPGRFKNGDVQIRMDISSAASELGWQPEISLEGGLHEVVPALAVSKTVKPAAAEKTAETPKLLPAAADVGVAPYRLAGPAVGAEVRKLFAVQVQPGKPMCCTLRPYLDAEEAVALADLLHELSYVKRLPEWIEITNDPSRTGGAIAAFARSLGPLFGEDKDRLVIHVAVLRKIADLYLGEKETFLQFLAGALGSYQNYVVAGAAADESVLAGMVNALSKNDELLASTLRVVSNPRVYDVEVSADLLAALRAVPLEGREQSYRGSPCAEHSIVEGVTLVENKEYEPGPEDMYLPERADMESAVRRELSLLNDVVEMNISILSENSMSDIRGADDNFLLVGEMLFQDIGDRAKRNIDKSRQEGRPISAIGATDLAIREAIAEAPSFAEFLNEVKVLLYDLKNYRFWQEKTARKDIADGKVVLLVREMTPMSIYILTRKYRLAAIVPELGTVTAHAAILARSHGIVVLTGAYLNGDIAQGSAFRNVPEGTPVLLDAHAGKLIINPSQRTRKVYSQYAKSLGSVMARVVEEMSAAGKTRDGQSAPQAVNMDNLEHMGVVSRLIGRAALAGIGLWRFEFLLMAVARGDWTRVDEIADTIYSELVKLQKVGVDYGRQVKVVIRTPDRDRQNLKLPGIDDGSPFEGTEWYVSSDIGRQVLEAALRAIARAEIRFRAQLAKGEEPRLDVQVIFPLVNTAAQARKLRKIVEDVRREFSVPVLQGLGVMVETPQAVGELRDIIKAIGTVRVINIGSNDMEASVLMLDREKGVETDKTLMNRVVLEQIVSTLEIAKENNIPVCVCGELANFDEMALFAIYLRAKGYDISLSVNPDQAAWQKYFVRQLDSTEVRRFIEGLAWQKMDSRKLSAALRREVYRILHNLGVAGVQQSSAADDDNGQAADGQTSPVEVKAISSIETAMAADRAAKNEHAQVAAILRRYACLLNVLEQYLAYQVRNGLRTAPPAGRQWYVATTDVAPQYNLSEEDIVKVLTGRTDFLIPSNLQCSEEEARALWAEIVAHERTHQTHPVWSEEKVQDFQARILSRSLKQDRFIQQSKAELQLYRELAPDHLNQPNINIFCSARITESSPYYVIAEKLSARLAGLGYGIITGGGLGLMEAANKGANDADPKATSLGMVLESLREQLQNAYLNGGLPFKHFFARKRTFLALSDASIALPGGFGTLDELFYMLHLKDQGLIGDYPIILYGTYFWQGLWEVLQEMEHRGLFHQPLQDLIVMLDEEEAVVNYLEAHKVIASRPHDLSRNGIKIEDIERQFREGFAAMSDLGPAVALFGSRTRTGARQFRNMSAMAEQFRSRDVSVMVPDDGDSVEAAVAGAARKDILTGNLAEDARIIALFNGSASLQAQQTKAYRAVHFNDNFIRNVVMAQHAGGVVLTQAGLDAMAFFFEYLTLMQTKLIEQRPVCLLDSGLFEKLDRWLHSAVEKEGLIDAQDRQLYRISRNAQEVVSQIMGQGKAVTEGLVKKQNMLQFIQSHFAMLPEAERQAIAGLVKQFSILEVIGTALQYAVPGVVFIAKYALGLLTTGVPELAVVAFSLLICGLLRAGAIVYAHFRNPDIDCRRLLNPVVLAPFYIGLLYSYWALLPVRYSFRDLWWLNRSARKFGKALKHAFHASGKPDMATVNALRSGILRAAEGILSFVQTSLPNAVQGVKPSLAILSAADYLERDKKIRNSADAVLWVGSARQIEELRRRLDGQSDVERGRMYFVELEGLAQSTGSTTDELARHIKPLFEDAAAGQAADVQSAASVQTKGRWQWVRRLGLASVLVVAQIPFAWQAALAAAGKLTLASVMAALSGGVMVAVLATFLVMPFVRWVQEKIAKTQPKEHFTDFIKHQFASMSEDQHSAYANLLKIFLGLEVFGKGMQQLGVGYLLLRPFLQLYAGSLLRNIEFVSASLVGTTMFPVMATLAGLLALLFCGLMRLGIAWMFSKRYPKVNFDKLLNWKTLAPFSVGFLYSMWALTAGHHAFRDFVKIIKVTRPLGRVIDKLAQSPDGISMSVIQALKEHVFEIADLICGYQVRQEKTTRVMLEPFTVISLEQKDADKQLRSGRPVLVVDALSRVRALRKKVLQSDGKSVYYFDMESFVKDEAWKKQDLDRTAYIKPLFIAPATVKPEVVPGVAFDQEAFAGNNARKTARTGAVIGGIVAGMVLITKAAISAPLSAGLPLGAIPLATLSGGLGLVPVAAAAGLLCIAMIVGASGAKRSLQARDNTETTVAEWTDAGIPYRQGLGELMDSATAIAQAAQDAAKLSIADQVKMQSQLDLWLANTPCYQYSENDPIGSLKGFSTLMIDEQLVPDMDCYKYIYFKFIRPDLSLEKLFSPVERGWEDELYDIDFDQRATGDIVFYFRDGKKRHVGIVAPDGRVESKFCDWLAYRHPVFAVPSIWGSPCVFRIKLHARFGQTFPDAVVGRATEEALTPATVKPEVVPGVALDRGDISENGARHRDLDGAVLGGIAAGMLLSSQAALSAPLLAPGLPSTVVSLAGLSESIGLLPLVAVVGSLLGVIVLWNMLSRPGVRFVKRGIGLGNFEHILQHVTPDEAAWEAKTLSPDELHAIGELAGVLEHDYHVLADGNRSAGEVIGELPGFTLLEKTADVSVDNWAAYLRQKRPDLLEDVFLLDPSDPDWQDRFKKVDQEDRRPGDMVLYELFGLPQLGGWVAEDWRVQSKWPDGNVYLFAPDEVPEEFGTPHIYRQRRNPGPVKTAPAEAVGRAAAEALTPLAAEQAAEKCQAQVVTALDALKKYDSNAAQLEPAVVSVALTSNKRVAQVVDAAKRQLEVNAAFALRAPPVQLMSVLAHEILHLLYPDDTEWQIQKRTLEFLIRSGLLDDYLRYVTALAVEIPAHGEEPDLKGKD
ncbi:MAG: NAD-dependent epimerase/dehydratase family protein, partial [Candidatus Omnitrophica bacterium]|nr:NAD-dependent epimerase/dehydratase family protein [Candidatus Omnitrophota bacterium]